MVCFPFPPDEAARKHTSCQECRRHLRCGFLERICPLLQWFECLIQRERAAYPPAGGSAGSSGSFRFSNDWRRRCYFLVIAADGKRQITEVRAAPFGDFTAPGRGRTMARGKRARVPKRSTIVALRSEINARGSQGGPYCLVTRVPTQERTALTDSSSSARARRDSSS